MNVLKSLKVKMFNNFFDRVKDNIQLILIIPTLLGGLWQIFELTNISVSFIRFFSLSQLVSDGLLILLILILIILILYFSKLVVRKPDEEDKELKNPKSYYKALRIVFNCGVVLYVMFPLFKSLYYEEEIILTHLLLAIFILILFGFNFLLSLYHLYLYYFERPLRYFFIKTTRKSVFFQFLLFLSERFIYLSSILLFIYLLGFNIFHFSSKIRNSYVFPKQLINIYNVECIIETNYNLKISKEDFIYFNDKYIFIKNKSTNNYNQEILIIKFDELFENEACIKNREKFNRNNTRLKEKLDLKQMIEKNLTNQLNSINIFFIKIRNSLLVNEKK